MAQYVTRRVAIPTASDVELVGPSPRRIAIVFPGPPTNRYTISAEATAVLDEGVNMYPAQTPWTMCREYHGDGPQRAWRAISAVADQIIVIGEVLE